MRKIKTLIPDIILSLYLFVAVFLPDFSHIATKYIVFGIDIRDGHCLGVLFAGVEHAVGNNEIDHQHYHQHKGGNQEHRALVTRQELVEFFHFNHEVTFVLHIYYYSNTNVTKIQV